MGHLLLLLSLLLVEKGGAFVHRHRSAFAPPKSGQRRGWGEAVAAVLDGARLLHADLKSPEVEKTKAFLGCIGLTPQRTDDAGASFVAFDGEMSQFELRVVGCASKEGSERDVVAGVSVAVDDIADVVARAEEKGAEVSRSVDNVTYVASVVPDEEIDLPQPWQLRAVLRDSASGFEVELIQHAPTSPRPSGVINHVTLRVPDIDEAAAFYSTAMGMTLHRKRSLVPTEPALSAFLSYEQAEFDHTLLELRYTYGKSKQHVPLVSRGPSTIAISAPSIEDAVAHLKDVGEEQVEDTKPSITAGPVEGVANDAALLSVTPGLNVVLLDELEAIMKRTI